MAGKSPWEGQGPPGNISAARNGEVVRGLTLGDFVEIEIERTALRPQEFSPGLSGRSFWRPVRNPGW